MPTADLAPSASASAAGRKLLAGYGCDERGPFLMLDELDREPWSRDLWRVRGQTFTLERRGERHCTGRHELATGHSLPCPERAHLLEPAREQCSPCFSATGFNPAFYNAPHVSEQQRRRNREPHVVYLVSFGPGALKVGMTFAPRRLSRLLEQGARHGAVIAELPDADAARELEAAIARDFGVAESVRGARKRQLLAAPPAPDAARRELGQMMDRVAARHPLVRPAPVRDLDPYYFGDERPEGALTDLTETEPLAISGRCIGMIGDVLVAAQGARRFLLGVSASVAHRIELWPRERENRFVGQLGLPF
ncbi:MAG TPA: DUF2797 domain-containing protein [Polyangiaceae bacterium]|nr:DUF2797 domain-containing protein [Polyangiaceae bacterium]